MPTATPFQLAGAAKRAGFTGANVAIAVAVALAESGGRTDATHRNSDGSIDHGAWQINDVNKSALALGNWADLDTNARMAYKVYVEQGWRAWSVVKSGAYKGHLAEGMKAAGNPAGPLTADIQTAGLPGVPDVFAKIVDPHTWYRVALVILGGALILVGLALIGWNSAPQGVKTAAKAVVTKGVVK